METVETDEAIETVGASKDKEKSKVEYPENLTQVSYIRYSIIFRKKSVPVLALFDLGNKVNAIHPTFARELGLFIRLTDVRIQKIDGTTLDTFEMTFAAFSMMDKAN